MSEIINPIKVKGFGDLVDSSDKLFKNHFIDKDLGYCLNVKKLFNLGYDQLIKIKNDLNKMEQTDEVSSHLEAVIFNMAMLEHKAVILNKEIEERNSKVF